MVGFIEWAKSKLSRGHSFVMWRGEKRVAKGVVRSSRKLLKVSHHLASIEEKYESRLKAVQKGSQKDKQNALRSLKELSDSFCNDVGKELKFLAAIARNDEALLYDMKKDFILTLQKEVYAIAEQGFPPEVAKGFLQKIAQLNAQLIQEAMKMSNKARTIQQDRAVVNVVLESTKMIAKEVRSDAKKVRHLIRDLDNLLDLEKSAHAKGSVKETSEHIRVILENLEAEFKFLEDIAEKDGILFKRLKKIINKIINLTLKASIPDSARKVLLAKFNGLNSSLNKELDVIRRTAQIEASKIQQLAA